MWYNVTDGKKTESMKSVGRSQIIEIQYCNNNTNKNVKD